MKGKDLLSVADLSREDIEALLSQARSLKEQRRSPQVLSGMVLALIFEKPSVRTRVSFEVAIHQLGGTGIYLSRDEVGLGKREPVPDVARVLSRYVDAMIVRTFSQQNLEVLAHESSVPVINALSDWEHPCQALSDLLTIYERKGKLGGLTLAFVGDGNNVANSLLLAAASVGMNFHIASPTGYEVADSLLGQARAFPGASGSRIMLTSDPREAVAGADVIYTDVWVSMGQEAERERRLAAFRRYQVTSDLVSQAARDVILMHPMPVHYGEEVVAGLLDGPGSVILDQAENRLHLQKALLGTILGGR